MILLFHGGDLSGMMLLLILFLCLVFVMALVAAFLFVIYLVIVAWNRDKAARKGKNDSNVRHLK